jgi:predicted Zn-ribbon and HTH transcriptional regulator
MAKQKTKQAKKRLLRVPRTGPAECNDCGQKFTGTSLDQALSKFREHKCKEDVNQAAARTVEKLTEGK